VISAVQVSCPAKYNTSATGFDEVI
jgi:hypothetical protein